MPASSLNTTADAKYDILKFLMSIMVVAIHAELFPLVLYPWLRMAVPLFFMITAYFLFTKLEKAHPDKQKQVLSGFVARNARLYGWWFLLLLPMTLYIRRTVYFSKGIGAGIAAFLKSLFFGSTFVASWYIPASVIAVLFIFFLTKHIRKESVTWILCLVVFCIVTLESSYAPAMDGTAFSKAIDTYSMIFESPVCSFPAAFLWIMAGRWFALNQVPPRISRLALPVFLLSCLGLYAEWCMVLKLFGSYNNDSYFMLLPVCFSFFCFFRSQNSMHLSFSPALRHASTVIYVSHGSLVYAISFCLKKLVHSVSPVLVFSLTLLCCLAINSFIEWSCRHWNGHPIVRHLKSLY